MNQAFHVFPPGQLLQPFEGSQIIHCLRKDHKTQRFIRGPVFRRVDDERIPRREAAACVCDQIRIHCGNGVLGIIKIVSPVQKSLHAVQVQLNAQNPVSGGRHGHKLIAHLTALDAAVIRPEILYSRLEKWLQEVVADNGMFHHSGLIDGKAAQRIDHMAVRQERPDTLLRRAVGFHLFPMRFV